MAYVPRFVQDLAELKNMRGNDAGGLIVIMVAYDENMQTLKMLPYIWDNHSTQIPDDMWTIVPWDNGPMGRWRLVTIQAGPTGPAGPTGATGATGPIGPTGSTGPAGPSTVGSPTNRLLSLATAYQATDPTKPSIVTLSLQANSSISLAGAVNNEAVVVIGSTNAVASGVGTAVGNYKNNLGGTLIIGLNLSNLAASSYTFALPAGWFFAIRQTSGTGLQIISAFDQSLG